jgi:hypothetical protein
LDYIPILYAYLTSYLSSIPYSTFILRYSLPYLFNFHINFLSKCFLNLNIAYLQNIYNNTLLRVLVSVFDFSGYPSSSWYLTIVVMTWLIILLVLDPAKYCYIGILYQINFFNSILKYILYTAKYNTSTQPLNKHYILLGLTVVSNI